MLVSLRKYIWLVVLALWSTGASAATIEFVGGTVLASRGQGFAPARNGEQLKPGMQLLTRQDSKAVIVYDDGCRVVLEANQNHTIGNRKRSGIGELEEISPCSTGSGHSGANVGFSAANLGVGLMSIVPAAVLLAGKDGKNGRSQPASP